MAKNLEKVYEHIRKKAKVFYSVFKSSQGQEILKALEDEFDHSDIKSSDPHETYYRLGQRDVVVYIRQLLKHMEKNNE